MGFGDWLTKEWEEGKNYVATGINHIKDIGSTGVEYAKEGVEYIEDIGSTGVGYAKEGVEYIKDIGSTGVKYAKDTRSAVINIVTSGVTGTPQQAPPEPPPNVSKEASDSKAAEIIAWNERYLKIIEYINNSPTTEVRLQRIKDYTDNGELDAFRKSGIDVDGHLKFQYQERYGNILQDIGESPREKRPEKYSYYLSELETLGSLGVLKDLDVVNDFYYLGLTAPFIFHKANKERQSQALNDRSQESLSRTQVVPNAGINTTISESAKDVPVGTPPVNPLFNQKIGDNIGIGTKIHNRQLNLLNVGAYDYLNVPNLRSSSVNGESPPNIKVVFGGGKVVYPTAVAIWDYATGLGRGLLGLQGEDYHDRSKVYQYGYSVGNRAMPLALEFEGIKGSFNPSILSPNYAVGFNGTLAETMTVDAWRIGSVVTGIESSRYNATKTDGSGKPTEGPGGAVNLSKSTNPKEFLDTALKKQGLETAPKGLKETWIEGDYKYEVRIHEANPEYGKSGSIYRVSRQKINIPEGQQGTGVEYMDANGTWHHQSTLKPGKNGNINPNYNDNAARETHIQVD